MGSWKSSIPVPTTVRPRSKRIIWVNVLAVVSLILCFVRIRTNSVAASTLVHATYNLSVFVSIFIATSGFHHLERL